VSSVSLLSAVFAGDTAEQKSTRGSSNSRVLQQASPKFGLRQVATTCVDCAVAIEVRMAVQ